MSPALAAPQQPPQPPQKPAAPTAEALPLPIPQPSGRAPKLGPRAERQRWTGPPSCLSCRAKLGRRGVLTQDRTRRARGTEPLIVDPQMPRSRLIRNGPDPLSPFFVRRLGGDRWIEWRCRDGKRHVCWHVNQGGDVGDAIISFVYPSSYHVLCWFRAGAGTARVGEGSGSGMAARASADAPRSSSWL